MSLKSPMALILSLALLGALAGCGGSSSSTSTSTASAVSTASTAATQRTTAQQGREQASKQGGSPPAGSSGPSPTDPNPLPNQGTKAVAPGVPTVKRGDNSIQTYGTEATAAERVWAARFVSSYLSDLANGDWAAACTHLPATTQQKMAAAAKKSPRVKGSGCGATLAALLGRAPESLLRAGARVHVLSLRVKSPQAFVVYRDGAGKAYNMPLRREDGGWRITALVGIALVL